MKQDFLERAPASMVMSLPLLTHNMRCRTYKAGKKRDVPSHSYTDIVTSFQFRLHRLLHLQSVEKSS